MKVIQPFFLGGGIGLVLALGIAAAFYLSPLRKEIYLGWDPEISDVRERMHSIRERTTAAELGIAAAEAEAPGIPAIALPAADSLKRVQAGAWKEYRHWRNRLGELSRTHDRATPAGFAHWIWSLRLLALPAVALLSLLPALLLAWRGARRARLPRMPRPPKPRASKDKGNSEAMTSFETAVRQVARISAASTGPAAPSPQPRSEAPPQPASPVPAANAGTVSGRKTEYLPEVPRRIPVTPEAVSPAPPEAESLPAEPSPYDPLPGSPFQEGNAGASPGQDGRPSRPEGRDTQILRLGPEGWGESGPGPGEPAPPEQPYRQSLSMEDEDDGEVGEGEEPPTGTFMPPTTEVERVERRKAEVLKLARKGLTSSEISRRMRISQDQVEFIIRMRREKG